MVVERAWKPDAVGRLFLWLLASMALGMVIGTFFEENADEEFKAMVISTVCFHAAALVFVQFFLWEQRMSWAEAFGLRVKRPGWALLCVIVAVLVTLPAAWFLNYLSGELMEWVHWQTEPQQVVQTIQNTTDLRAQLYLAGMAIVIVPFSEELLFRGILYPFLAGLGHRRVALWATSILFGAVHFNPTAFVPLTFLGVVLILLYEATETLLAPILAHSLFNLANYSLLSVLPTEGWVWWG